MRFGLPSFEEARVMHCRTALVTAFNAVTTGADTTEIAGRVVITGIHVVYLTGSCATTDLAHRITFKDGTS